MDQPQTSQVQAQPVPQGSQSVPAAQGNSGIDLKALQALTQQELANRPEQATAFTQGANPGQATAPAQTPATNEDPLQKLMQMVSEKQATAPEELPQKLFVVVKGKISNELLDMMVVKLLESGLNPLEVINVILKLDKQVEDGKVDNSTFARLLQ
jgi:signal recognition particle GTPase